MPDARRSHFCATAGPPPPESPSPPNPRQPVAPPFSRLLPRKRQPRQWILRSLTFNYLGVDPGEVDAGRSTASPVFSSALTLASGMGSFRILGGCRRRRGGRNQRPRCSPQPHGHGEPCGRRWTVRFGSLTCTMKMRIKKKVLEAPIYRANICLYELMNMIQGVGFSSVHFLYYRKKYARGGSGHLVRIDHDSDVRNMISEHNNEKRVQLYVFKERAKVNVAPSEPHHDDEMGSNRVHQTYTVSVRDDENDSEERDDAHYSFLKLKKGSVLVTRMESITAYKNKHGQHRSGTKKQSDTHVSDNDMCTLDEWPSHARRNRPQPQNESDGQKNKERGVLKGFKATNKRFANGSAKLNISFSENLGGAIGMNNRSFKDDVVVIMKRKLPLIGVRKWSDIHPTIHRQIVADMMDRWELEDTPETEEKILKIAKERYRGWRSTLSSTYKAYKTDAARLANVPEDLQPEEWEWMIEYFGTDSKFQEISQKNSDNRKRQKTKHRTRSKSYSQLSFEKRDLETGEEPDCIALWELTHTKNGTWTDKESQKVYEEACQLVQNKENETHGPVSSEHRSNIFQTAYKDTLKCKSSQPRGYGYMAKPPSGSERIKSQFEEQARATAETQKVNAELSHQVNELQDQLQAERESTQERINLERAERENLQEMLKEERVERDRLIEEERRSRVEFETNMMKKFAQLSQQMGTHQVPKKRTSKENCNPNLQNALSLSSSPNRILAPRPSVISSNALIQAATRNNRMFRAVDPKN